MSGYRWRQLATQLAPGATEPELEYFAEVCRRLELSPFTSPAQIVLIGRHDGRVDRVVFRPQVTVDGRLALARRTGRIVGIQGPEWTGKRDEWTVNGVRRWTDVWDVEDNIPRAARYFVHVAGDVVPVNGTVTWTEFCPRGKDGKPPLLWQAMPANMLAKTALSLALRRSGVEPSIGDIAVGAVVDAETGEIPEEVYDALPEARGREPDENGTTGV